MKFFLAFLITIASVISFAQKDKTPVKIINADVLEFEERIPEGKVKKLIGHVILGHKDVRMYADSVNLYEDTDNFDAYGNVHITRGDSLDIKADSLFYYSEKKLVELLGRIVRLDNKEMIVTTDQMYYNMKKKYAYYLTNGKVESPDFTITSQKGYYHEQTKNAHFKTNVDVVSPDYKIITDTMVYHYATKNNYFYGPTTLSNDSTTIYCEQGFFNEKTKDSKFQYRAWVKTPDLYIKGDTIYYNEQSGVGRAYNNVEWIDSSGENIIFGDYAEYLLDEEYSKVFDNALYANVSEEGDTLWLGADTLVSNQTFYLNFKDTFGIDTLFMRDSIVFDTFPTKDSTVWDTVKYREIYAYYDVKIFKKDLQAVADSMYFNSLDSIFWLFQDPILWTDSSQMNGDTSALVLKNKQLHRMYLRTDAMIVNLEHEPELYNQIKGDKITGFFRDDTLRTMLAEKNAESLYYLRNEDSAFVGANKAKCSMIEARFKKNDLNTVTFLATPSAKFHPMEGLNASSLNFPNFKWQIEYKPKSKDDLLIPGDRYNYLHPEKMPIKPTLQDILLEQGDSSIQDTILSQPLVPQLR